jgi:Dolichyl-phosphate-mannose-protein mannosyltransferase
VAQTVETAAAPRTAVAVGLDDAFEPEADLDERSFRRGVVLCATAVGAFLLLRLTAWPPHEDETLALYVGRGSLGELLDTVLGERGGAPLHFLFAWVVAHVGGGLAELRLVSAAFAVASVPLTAALAVRLAGRRVALVAATLTAASWVLLFHGIYARMYSLFLATSLLSFLALLAALRAGGRRRWALWVAATIAMVSSHPYGALVVASQAAYAAATRSRLRESAWAFATVGVLGLPFWIADLRLAERFEVGVGGGGERLGGPLSVGRYLVDTAGDFSAGRYAVPVVLVLAALGAWRLGRAALLPAAVIAVPAAAFLFARLGSSTSPESRHLVFVLPFFSTLVAAGLVVLAARFGRRAAVGLGVLLVAGQIAWAYDKTPPLFVGEPSDRVAARQEASAWLASTGRADDVLLGYDPVFLGAWERQRDFSRTVLPRADARLALNVLRGAHQPLGRGVWLLDAYDTNNVVRRLEIPLQLPRPPGEFEARVFGPYLVIRTREPTRTPERYLRAAAAAMIVGKMLDLGDADVNFATIDRAAALLGAAYRPSASSAASRSTSSR